MKTELNYEGDIVMPFTKPTTPRTRRLGGSSKNLAGLLGALALAGLPPEELRQIESDPRFQDKVDLTVTTRPCKMCGANCLPRKVCCSAACWNAYGEKTKL